MIHYVSYLMYLLVLFVIVAMIQSKLLIKAEKLTEE